MPGQAERRIDGVTFAIEAVSPELVTGEYLPSGDDTEGRGRACGIPTSGTGWCRERSAEWSRSSPSGVVWLPAAAERPRRVERVAEAVGCVDPPYNGFCCWRKWPESERRGRDGGSFKDTKARQKAGTALRGDFTLAEERGAGESAPEGQNTALTLLLVDDLYVRFQVPRWTWRNGWGIGACAVCRGVWRPQYSPHDADAARVVRKLKEIFRRYRVTAGGTGTGDHQSGRSGAGG